MHFRVIDGLSVRFAQTECRDDQALLLNPCLEVEPRPVTSSPAVETGCEAGDGVAPARPIAVLAR